MRKRAKRPPEDRGPLPLSWFKRYTVPSCESWWLTVPPGEMTRRAAREQHRMRWGRSAHCVIDSEREGFGHWRPTPDVTRLIRDHATTTPHDVSD
jgi:hypothetical protein